MNSYTTGKSNAWEVVYLFLFKMKNNEFYILYLDIHNVYTMKHVIYWFYGMK